MKPPRLNHPLVLEAPERVDDGAGGFVEGWVERGRLWGEIIARTGRETAHGGAPVSRVGYKIVVRSAPAGAPERPMPEQRFRNGSRIFTIEAVAERDVQCRYLTCFVQEEIVV